MAIYPNERPTLHLLLPDKGLRPGTRLYLIITEEKLPIGYPVPKHRLGIMGNLIPVAEVFPTFAGPLRAFGIKEFCALTGMSSRTFSRLWRSGSLVARKIGGRTIVTYEDAMAFLRNLPEANAIDKLLVSSEEPLDEAC